MASGSCQDCEEEDEETLKKLIVRLNNVQEGKQIETLVQILEDMLVFTYADHGNRLPGNCPFTAPRPGPPSPPAFFFTNFLPPNFVAAQTWILEEPQTLYSLGQKRADNSRKVLSSLLLFSPSFSDLKGVP